MRPRAHAQRLRSEKSAGKAPILLGFGYVHDPDVTVRSPKIRRQPGTRAAERADAPISRALWPNGALRRPRTLGIYWEARFALPDAATAGRTERLLSIR